MVFSSPRSTKERISAKAPHLCLSLYPSQLSRPPLPNPARRQRSTDVGIRLPECSAHAHHTHQEYSRNDFRHPLPSSPTLGAFPTDFFMILRRQPHPATKFALYPAFSARWPDGPSPAKAGTEGRVCD
jgi:hypothetical protein